LRVRLREQVRELADYYALGRPCRRWPIFKPIKAFREEFGIDTYLYHKLVRDMMLLCVYLMIANVTCAVVYSFLDMVPQEAQKSSGLFPLFQSYPYEVFAVLFQAITVLGHVLFRRSVQTARRAVVEDESQNIYSIADYTIVLTGIPCQVSDVEVKAFMEEVASDFTVPGGSSGTGRARPSRDSKAIAKYTRILTPAILGYRNRRAALKYEYYTKLTEDQDSLLQPPRSCFRRFSDIIRLTPLLQRVGAYRDRAYYDRQRAALNSKIAHYQIGKWKHTDTAFVTFHDAQVCLFVLWRLNGVSVREVRRIQSWKGAGRDSGKETVDIGIAHTIQQSRGREKDGQSGNSPLCCHPERFVSPAHGCGLCACRAPKLLKKYRLSASRAPEPEDVIWKNLHSTAARRFLGSCVSFCIALLITGALAICVLALRQLRREMSMGASSVFEEYAIYVGMYLVILLFDQGMRPILRWAVTFERQHTYTAQERSFFWKYFFYNLLNRLAPMYSRNFLQLIVPDQGGDADAVNFLDIIKYTKEWRYSRNTAGEDLMMLMIIQIFGYNLLDLLVFGGRIAFLLATAASAEDKRNALKGLPIRYANFYSNLMCSSIIVLAYSYAQPVIVPMFLVYLCVHSLVLRVILLRLSAQPPRTAGSLAAEADWILWFGSIFAMACVAQGQIGHGSLWYLLTFLTVLLAFEAIFNPWTFRQASACLLRSSRAISGSRMQRDAIRVSKVRDLPPFSSLKFGSYDPEAGHGLSRAVELRAQEILFEEGQDHSGGQSYRGSYRGSSRLSVEAAQRSSGRTTALDDQGITGDTDTATLAGSGTTSKRESAVLGAGELREALGRDRAESLTEQRKSTRYSVRYSIRERYRSLGQAIDRKTIDEELRRVEEEGVRQILEGGQEQAAEMAGPGDAGGTGDASQGEAESEVERRMLRLLRDDSVDDAE